MSDSNTDNVIEFRKRPVGILWSPRGNGKNSNWRIVAGDCSVINFQKHSYRAAELQAKQIIEKSVAELNSLKEEFTEGQKKTEKKSYTRLQRLMQDLAREKAEKGII